LLLIVNIGILDIVNELLNLLLLNFGNLLRPDDFLGHIYVVIVLVKLTKFVFPKGLIF
jgi:hypothetical protein